MILTTKVKLLTSKEDASLLYSTIVEENRFCNWLSEKVWSTKIFKRYDIHYNFYYIAREKFPKLSSQVIIRCIAKVANSYRSNKTKQKFRRLGSVSYDYLLLTFKKCEDIVSIWTIEGRKQIRVIYYNRQREQLKSRREGEIRLLLQSGKFFLAIYYDVQEPKTKYGSYKKPLGIDLGVI